MGIIRELDYNTVVKIAAGEVIDRPASLVRELLDNSIDADSQNIKIHIVDGGKASVEIQDDGKGMDQSDLALCTKNHTTSKIEQFDDIETLCSLGFRGEALASIAEVTDLTIQSKQEGSGEAYKIHSRYGEWVSMEVSAHNRGTTVIARGLFDNLPARKKFLSSAASETKFINKEIVKKALAFPNISFEFFSEGKRKYITPKRKTHLERIYDFFPDVTDYLLPIEYLSERMTVFGFVGKSAFIRPNRLYQHFFVNNRAVEWKNFFFAVQNAYGNLIPKGFFPAVFLYVSIHAENVDINVHPMKREVRFRDEYGVSREIQKAIAETLQRDSGVVTVEYRDASRETRIGESIASYLDNYGDSVFNLPSLAKDPIPMENEPNLFESESDGGKSQSQYNRLVGVVFQTYILLENGDEIVFVDQHAAHERINYHKLTTYYQSESQNATELLIPVNIEVPLDIVEDLIAGLSNLTKMGFEVEHFGGNHFIVRSAPDYIRYSDIADVVMGYIETVQENSGLSTHSADFIDNAIKQMSCKTSIRAGDSITPSEVKALLEELSKTPNRHSCPHGRPIQFSLPKRELEKQFKRLGF